MSDLPFGRRVSVDGGVQSITLIHGPSSLLSPYAAAIRPPSHAAFPFAHLRCTVTSLIPGRQADRRTLKPCSQRAFPIFHLRSAERKGPKYPCCFPFPAALPGIKLLPRRELMLAAANSFLFFTARVIPRRLSLRLVSPCLMATQPANKGFLLQRRRSEPDRPSFTA